MRVPFVLLLTLFAWISPTASAATVAGVVTGASSGLPVSGATVTLEYWAGFLYMPLGTANTNAQGEYAITSDFVGAARLRTSANGFLPLEAQVAMPAGTGQVTVNLALLLPAVIAGRVTDLSTGLPLAGKTLRAHATGTGYRYADSGSDGNYAFTGLAPGSYGVCLMDDRDAYMNQCWDHVIANSLTNPSNYLPVSVVAGEVRQGINFDLQAGAHISGVILNRRSGLPPANSPYLQILLRTTATDFIQIPVQLDSNGRYLIDGLAPGSYQAISQSNAPYYTSQLFAGIDCLGSNCDFPNGSNIVIDADLNSHDDIDFSMIPGGRLQGRVLDRNTLAPIADATVELWVREPFIGTPFRKGTTQTDTQGYYALDHVETAQHLVVVRSPTHIAQRYPDIPCFIDCTSNTQGGITIPANATVDLNPMWLDLGVRISGQARLPGLSTTTFAVSLFNAQQSLGSVVADMHGHYQFPPWVPGTYFLQSSAGAQCQLYRWLPCTQPPISGTPVVLAAPGDTYTADFDLFIDDIHQAGFESE